ncbi:DUF3068 domain-containing protein [Yimella sp. cx-51]|nr:DUF3068 domain-containing protein [Yimella sp. cx-51]
MFLGAFLLAVAVVAKFYAANEVKRTPLDTNTVTHLSGKASIFDGKSMVDTPVTALSTTLADSAASTKDVVLFKTSSCLIKAEAGSGPDCVSADDPQKRLIAAGTDVFATDRRTGLAVSDFKGLPADAERKSGLMNKFPFDVEKKTYPFWDDYAKKAIDTKFVGTEKLNGLETYKFAYEVKAAPIEISGAAGTYDTEKTMWIDPVTGSIQKQEQHLVQRMASGQTVIDINFAFTPEQVAENVKSAKESGTSLKQIGSTVPLLGTVVGLLLLAVGLLMWFSNRKRNAGGASRYDDDVDRNAGVGGLLDSDGVDDTAPIRRSNHRS